MTDEAQVTVDQDVQENDNNEQTPKTKTCKRSCFVMGGVVILLVLIIAGLVIGGYYLKNIQHEMQEEHAEIRKMQVGLAHSQDQQYQQQKSLELQNEQIAAVKEHLGFNQAKWQLAESQYLLKLANFNLQYQENSRVALQLVNTADNLLNKIQLSELQPIRNQLSDITYQLQSIQSTDVATILARLNTLQTKAITLEMPIPSYVEEQTTNQTKSNQPSEGWKEHFQSTLTELKDMVVVRYHDKPISEQQLPMNRGYLREQLAMLLTQAEWAVMRNEQHLYQTALKQGLDWIQQYFDTENANVQTFTEALQQLQQVSIAESRYPDLSPVIDDINSILQRKNAMQTNTTTAPSVADDEENA